MKRLLIILFILASVAAISQPTTLPNYTTINSRYNWLGGMFRALNLPVGCGYPVLKSGQWVGSGGVYLDSCLNRPYYYNEGLWYPVLDSATIVSLVNSATGSPTAGYGLTQVNDTTIAYDYNLRDSMLSISSLKASLAANSITNAHQQTWDWSSITSSAMGLSMNGTYTGSGNKKLMSLTSSGTATGYNSVLYVNNATLTGGGDVIQTGIHVNIATGTGGGGVGGIVINESTSPTPAIAGGINVYMPTSGLSAAYFNGASNAVPIVDVLGIGTSGTKTGQRIRSIAAGTLNVGLDIQTYTATDNYAIRARGQSAFSYTTTSPTPTAIVWIDASTATIPQLKLAASTLLATPQAQSIENTTTHLYWTDAGGTRYQLDQQGGGGGWGYTGSIATLTGASVVNVDGYALQFDSVGSFEVTYDNGADQGSFIINQGLSGTFDDGDIAVTIAADPIGFANIKVVDAGAATELNFDVTNTTTFLDSALLRLIRPIASADSMYVKDPITGKVAIAPVSGGGSSAFSALTTSTNTTATMTVGAGASLTFTSTGVVNANQINGTALSGLATGILKNTTTTGVPSIAVAGDFPALPYWGTSGNSSLTPNTNFIGLTDNSASLVVKTNNLERLRIDSSTVDGRVRIYLGGLSSYLYSGIDATNALTYSGAAFYSRTSGSFNIYSNTSVYTGVFYNGEVAVGSAVNATGARRFAIYGQDATHSAIQLMGTTIKTAAIAGGIDYNGTDLFLANSVPTRNIIAQVSGTTPLTSGTVPVATTNGYLTDGLILAATTYTPTITNGVNVDASTAYDLQYMRVGSVVTVSGKVDIDATSASTNTAIEFSLPVASNFAVNGQAAGTGGEDYGVRVTMYANVTDDRVVLHLLPSGTANTTYWFTFTYQII